MGVSGILHNVLLLSAIFAWAAAQLLKMLINLVNGKKFDLRWLWGSGGMPSSHSAAVCALAVSAGLLYGFEHYAFALSALLALIVMYDACGVRREAGEHARILNRLEDMLFSESLTPEEKLKEFIGHTPLQVVFGAVLGISVAVILFFL